MPKRSRLPKEKKFHGLTAKERSRLRWRKERVGTSIVFRRIGQRDPMHAVRVLIAPSEKGGYKVLERSASWFDFVVHPDYDGVTKDVAIAHAKEFMDTGFHYD